jgi:hypothetical protein
MLLESMGRLVCSRWVKDDFVASQILNWDAELRQACRRVVEAVNGQLVESHPDGSTKVLKTLAGPIHVAVGQRRALVGDE